MPFASPLTVFAAVISNLESEKGSITCRQCTTPTLEVFTFARIDETAKP